MDKDMDRDIFPHRMQPTDYDFTNFEKTKKQLKKENKCANT